MSRYQLLKFGDKTVLDKRINQINVGDQVLLPFFRTPHTVKEITIKKRVWCFGRYLEYEIYFAHTHASRFVFEYDTRTLTFKPEDWIHVIEE